MLDQETIVKYMYHPVLVSEGEGGREGGRGRGKKGEREEGGEGRRE